MADDNSGDDEQTSIRRETWQRIAGQQAAMSAALRPLAQMQIELQHSYAAQMRQVVQATGLYDIVRETSAQPRLRDIVREALEAHTDLRAQVQQAMTRSVAPAVQAAARAQMSIELRQITALRTAASQPWRTQLQVALPLIQDRFAPQVMSIIEETLEAIEDADSDDMQFAAAELPDETLSEIEEALASFEPALQGLSPELARRLWIWWVQAFVFALSLQALILLPAAAEITALMGTGALAAAKQAGDGAAKIWDKLHPGQGTDSGQNS
ncbi:hypothetical protein ACFW81_01485 [Streptomyces angustmyceticus]|uniref:hypothetical protein n=1 Tax=Streptomyces angustmyceticus TaxID=285578 RepID=UPI0036964ECB